MLEQTKTLFNEFLTHSFVFGFGTAKTKYPPHSLNAEYHSHYLLNGQLKVIYGVLKWNSCSLPFVQTGWSKFILFPSLVFSHTTFRMSLQLSVFFFFFFLHIADAQTRTPMVCFLCVLWKRQTKLASLQSGFAVTLSLRGPHEGRLGSPQNGLGACQWAACQHTARLGTSDVLHEDERTDWRKGRGMEREVRTGENNTCSTGGQVWVEPLQSLLFPLHSRFLCMLNYQRN